MKRAEEWAGPSKRPRVADDKPDPEPQVENKTVRFEEKGALLTLSEDGLTLSGSKGYCMARANCGVKYGTYYYELMLQPAESEYHVRFGYGTKKADINAPAGFDEYSYAYRDLNGACVHKSTRRDAYGAPFGPGDVVGALISLPKPCENSCGATVGAPEDMPPGSDECRSDAASAHLAGTIRFFVNGKDQGVAFDDVPCGDMHAYYPVLSIYHAGTVVATLASPFAAPPTEYAFEAIPYAQEV
ncbi:hypothetical protein ACHHYP_02177 [Achlya hypogyna]|uniref:B30.2/SPRY domain-containing protein n=1 Tax=Achlya hypogyna TaxID=1202772 RepID=A0A1V9ZS82_ACHHY|nr:hypothetical protein ACHHYP_02177 [Achlya hypogyna]